MNGAETLRQRAEGQDRDRTGAPRQTLWARPGVACFQNVVSHSPDSTCWYKSTQKAREVPASAFKHLHAPESTFILVPSLTEKEALKRWS